MIPDGTYTAVIDEIEDSLARLELEAADGELYELVLDVAELPAAGRETGSVLTIECTDDEVTDAKYDPDGTERRSEAAQDRFDRLSQRPSDDQ
ncbi:DUF3006 domain-containing protein [Natronomonas sp. F2-12]|jgi:hypothetical protein|uniref:DUF3006 domain-containing protein n=1 Tax=Natronomonas aquatica TaxID=2841590 RepID=A0A9R1CW36_9EURY|nr:DUF3006 domain-containing protein [Natronomonas aquatica]MCQ4334848.1 DUF3006 domain-containing protein [Natronomonas aquatica]